jgi:hypothetical protein
MKESRLEKPVRASFLTTLNRKLAKRSVVIADGLNYIKGYRYQMNCAAKEAGVRYCTVRLVLAQQRLGTQERLRRGGAAALPSNSSTSRRGQSTPVPQSAELHPVALRPARFTSLRR